jgi:hypothetical protein
MHPTKAIRDLEPDLWLGRDLGGSIHMPPSPAALSHLEISRTLKLERLFGEPTASQKYPSRVMPLNLKILLLNIRPHQRLGMSLGGDNRGNGPLSSSFAPALRRPAALLCYWSHEDGDRPLWEAVLLLNTVLAAVPQLHFMSHCWILTLHSTI